MIEERRINKSLSKEANHNLIMENRKKVSISGVEDVESFDEESVVLYTEMGVLTIKGVDLHINKLNVENGEVNVEGEINNVAYADSDGQGSKGMGFLSRMFK